MTSVRQRRRVKDLPTPAFVINRHALKKNCRVMLDMAKERELSLRPHVKTHKTSEGAWIQATGGDVNFRDHVAGFVASTLPEVSMLVQAAPRYGGPFEDILYGVPISASKLPDLDALRTKGFSKIHILIDHSAQVTSVEDYVACSSARTPFSAFLKLDTGYHRAGITCDERGVDLAMHILQSPHLVLHGVYSHCGHAYDEESPEKQLEIANTDTSLIQSFLELLKERVEATDRSLAPSLETLVVSVGSTPSARHHTKKTTTSPLEIHPGNYTLFDRQQLWTGACQEADLAGRVMARVIGHYEDRNTIMLDAGATALTKDSSPQGGVCAVGGHPEVECYKMSQEVTLVRSSSTTTTSTDANFPFESFPLGSIVNLLPNHSCLAAACFDKYYIIDDATNSFSPEQPILNEWVPAKFF